MHATFFVLGRHAERWPELVRRVADEGHQLGNHGYFHRKLHRRSPGYVRDDLTRGTEPIVRASGVRPRALPRAARLPQSVGHADRRARSASAPSAGRSASGTRRGPARTSSPRATLDGMHAGSILLLHDGDGYDPEGDRMQTAEALPRIIDGLRERGFRFATLPD